jgi:hypothetical protein
MGTLSAKQLRFVQEYLVDLSATQAAMRAGYSAKTARSIGSENLTKPDIQNAIAVSVAEQKARLELDADEMVRMLSAIVLLDRNELIECRRVACRHCYSPNDDPQETPAEQAARRKQYDELVRQVAANSQPGLPIANLPPFDPLGGARYDARKPPAPDCTSCFGDGEVRVIFKDTTKLSPAARTVFEGVKVTRGGMEYKMFSRSKAMELLTRRWGLTSPDLEPSAGRTETPASFPKDPIEAAKLYLRLMDG